MISHSPRADPYMPANSPLSNASPVEWKIAIPDERATGVLAAQIAKFAGPDVLITLSGELGAGKTTFARALLRHLTGDPDLEVPSPTFTLMQTYYANALPIVHADLYRIESADELIELGWEEAIENALVLVEWAERAEGALAEDRLDIAFYNDPNQGPEWRRAVLTGHGTFGPKLALERGVDRLLSTGDWAGAERAHMMGDASTRAYERLHRSDGKSAILMISPARPDGPPVRFGKSYSAIARLAEDVRPFLAMSEGLRSLNLSAPEIYKADAQSGLAILEDLGQEGIIENGAPMIERYMQAAALLAYMHGCTLSDTIEYGESETYRIPPFDNDAMLIEIELLNDWYGPHVKSRLASGAKAIFVNLWRKTLQEIAGSKTTWVLRDFHSPNIIWLPDRTGLAQVGVIDFQDCVMGSPAYDLASLLQDARISVSEEMEFKLLSHYAQLRRDKDPEFNVANFTRDYAIMCAQRATKILGIFARLSYRDGKHSYLDHIPRIENYLAKALAHPALSEIRSWYAQHMPHIVSGGETEN